MMPVELIPVLEVASKRHGHFRLDSLSDSDITQIVLEHTAELRSGVYDRASTCPLFGGYVLSVDGTEIFYPQCCGDLSDINYWANLAKGVASGYNGHPGPFVTFKGESVKLDFSDDEYETYNPQPARTEVTLTRSDLAAAVLVAKEQLRAFASSLQKVNTDRNLGIVAIENLLVWGDSS